MTRNGDTHKLPRPSECVCLNLRKANRAITQFYDDGMRITGFRSTQVAILRATLALEPVTITQLAETMVTDRTTLTRNLKLLERKGLITIKPGDDRREHQVSIRQAGKAVVRKAYPGWERMQGKLIQAVGQARLNRLFSDLTAVVAAAKQA